MTTIHVATLIDIAKEVGKKESDPSLAARSFCSHLIGTIAYYDRTQANELAKALHLAHVTHSWLAGEEVGDGQTA